MEVLLRVWKIQCRNSARLMAGKLLLHVSIPEDAFSECSCKLAFNFPPGIALDKLLSKKLNSVFRYRVQ